MDAAAGIGGLPSSQAARKERHAVTEHSFGSNGGEVKWGQSAERTIFEAWAKDDLLREQNKELATFRYASFH
ncbi:hypothetical protein GW17_00037972 [Ensete ventricosum]|nr:hypothetical protein GW17_00037972 [Ensete ventricosum]